MFALFTVGYCVFYLFPNFRPIWEPQFLPLLPIDVATPFLPWTFLIYCSDYVLISIAILSLTRLEDFNSFCRMCFMTLFLCGTFFLFFPTTYPRPEYDFAQGLPIQALMLLVATVDMPTNCFPSMHVALTAVASWSMRRFGRTVQITFWIWAFAIFASTMTTKQHYVMDILAGMGVMMFVATIDWVVFQKKSEILPLRSVRLGLEKESS